MGFFDNAYAGMPGIITGEASAERNQATTRLQNMEAMKTFMTLFPNAAPEDFTSYVDKIAGGDNWERGQLPTQQLFQSFSEEQAKRQAAADIARQSEALRVQAQSQDFLEKAKRQAAEMSSTPEEFRDRYIAAAGQFSPDAVKQLDINGAANEYNMSRQGQAARYAKDLIDMGVFDKTGVEGYLGPTRKSLVPQVTSIVEAAHKDNEDTRAIQRLGMQQNFYNAIDPARNEFVREALVTGADLTVLIGNYADSYGITDPAAKKKAIDWVGSQTEMANRITANKTAADRAGQVSSALAAEIKRNNDHAKGAFTTEGLWTSTAGLSKSLVPAATELGMRLITEGYNIDNPDRALLAVADAVRGKIPKTTEAVAAAAGLKRVSPAEITQAGMDIAGDKYTPRPFEEYKNRINGYESDATAALTQFSTLLSGDGLPEPSLARSTLSVAQRNVDKINQEIAMLIKNPEIATNEKSSDIWVLRDRANRMQDTINLQVADYKRRQALGVRKAPTAAPGSFGDAFAKGEEQNAAATEHANADKAQYGNAQAEVEGVRQNIERLKAYMWQDDVLGETLTENATRIANEYPNSGLTMETIRRYLTGQVKAMRVQQYGGGQTQPKARLIQR